MDAVERGRGLLRKLIIFVLAYEVVCAVLLLAVQLFVGGAVIVQLARSVSVVALSVFLFSYLYKGIGWARIICLFRFAVSAFTCIVAIIAEPEFLTLLYLVTCLVVYTVSFTTLLSNKDILSYMKGFDINASS